MIPITDLRFRRAEPDDADAIALAHRDSIQSLGPARYPQNVVDDWQEGLTEDVYRNAMQRGEVFFIATADVDGSTLVLGFSSDYVIEGSTHGTSVYVRGLAARRGIGSRLLAMAEDHARSGGATTVTVEASLTGVEFYKAQGFQETSRGETHLMSGRPISCVFMTKELRHDSAPDS
jgi:putative acetyltransferase